MRAQIVAIGRGDPSEWRAVRSAWVDDLSLREDDVSAFGQVRSEHRAEVSAHRAVVWEDEEDLPRLREIVSLHGGERSKTRDVLSAWREAVSAFREASPERSRGLSVLEHNLSEHRGVVFECGQNLFEKRDVLLPEREDGLER